MSALLGAILLFGTPAAAEDSALHALETAKETLRSAQFELGLQQAVAAVAQAEIENGPSDWLVADALMTRAAAHSGMGNFATARLDLERALSIAEGIYGRETTELADVIAPLAVTFFQLGDYPLALEHFQRVLSIRETELEGEHEDLPSALNNVAHTLKELGRYAEALPLQQRALDIRIRRNGPEHEEVGRILVNLGQLAQDVGDYETATEHFERAVEVLSAALGPEHIDVSVALQSLGQHQVELGDAEGAMATLQRSLQIHTSRTPQTGHDPAHPGLAVPGRRRLRHQPVHRRAYPGHSRERLRTGSPRVHPYDAEACDFLDNDCDGLIDEGFPNEWWFDLDGDGYGDASHLVPDLITCANQSNMVANNDDCDDTDANVHPDAVEVCDGVDNNCSGIMDDEDLLNFVLYFRDDDNDGYGNPLVSRVDCNQPDGYTTDGNDCDDSASSVHPGADELCNGIDDDCNGVLDNNPIDGIDWYADSDADGFGDVNSQVNACDTPGPEFVEDLAGDCDDTDPAVNPDAKEVCDDVIDNDCDDEIDEDCDFGAAKSKDEGGGCGCQSAPRPAGLGWLVLLALGATRRRHSR